MSRMKKLLSLTMAASLSFSTIAQAQWWQIGEKWKFSDTTGKLKTGWFEASANQWYHFNDVGEMDTGYIKYKGNLYYLAEKNNGVEGLMKTGWYQDPLNKAWRFFDTNTDSIGVMAANCWKWIDGYCFYFGADGTMAQNTSIEGFTVDKDGYWIVNGIRQFVSGKGVSSKVKTIDDNSGTTSNDDDDSIDSSVYVPKSNKTNGILTDIDKQADRFIETEGSSDIENRQYTENSTNTVDQTENITYTDPEKYTSTEIQTENDEQSESEIQNNPSNQSEEISKNHHEIGGDITRYEWLNLLMESTDANIDEEYKLINEYADIDEDSEDGRK